MPSSPYEEAADHFVAPSFRGSSVARVALDHQITLHVGSDTIVIEQPASLLLADGAEVLLDAGKPETLGVAGSLLHAVCQSVVLRKSGELVVQLADGRRLEVSPDPAFEAWQIFVRGSAMVVCQPGGELAFSPGGDA